MASTSIKQLKPYSEKYMIAQKKNIPQYYTTEDEFNFIVSVIDYREII